MQAGVKAALRKQCGMIALFDQPPGLEHEHAVGMSPRRAPSALMGNNLAPLATPVACSLASRMSISTALPDSSSVRAVSNETESASSVAASQP